MCLVEVESSPKPVASCAMPIAKGMIIHTESAKTREARRGVMEFLLLNHPLDCPICDQGGECDLQDQAMAYGLGYSRSREAKRAVGDKDMGPLIKTAMTRCIHCTRCVRFVTEVAGVDELGSMGRGESMEIDLYLGRSITSELSGNIIDLCPVGALTSKPYAFTARPWELNKVDSIDVTDALLSAIRLDSRGREVMRATPRIDEAVNEEWLSDKGRFAIDGLKHQRLDRPYARLEAGGKLQAVSWDQAFHLITAKISMLEGKQIAAIAGDQCELESMFALRELMRSLGSPHTDCRQDGAFLPASPRVAYLFNSTIAGIDHADACLLVGTDPRREAPVLNARLRKRWLQGGFPIALIGAPSRLTYDYQHLGIEPQALCEIAAGRGEFSQHLYDAKWPMLIVGTAALARPDGARILGLCREIADRFTMITEGWNGFNVLHRAAARVGGLDIGFVPGHDGRDLEGIFKGCEAGKIKAVYLLAADEINMDRLSQAFVVYQGHHGDRGAVRADVVLPGAAYTEKDGLYVNTEGRPRRALRAVTPPGIAREDWRIIRALSQHLGPTLPYDDLATLREHLIDAHPWLSDIDTVRTEKWEPFGMSEGSVDAEPFMLPIANFYMSCALSRTSPTMARCTALTAGSYQNGRTSAA